MVVELTPAFDQHACFSDVAEPLAIQALIAKLFVKALNEAVLSWPTRCDVHTAYVLIGRAHRCRVCIFAFGRDVRSWPLSANR